MKKILALVLVCFLAVSFVACGGNEDNESSSAFQTSSMAESKADTSVADKSEAESATSKEESTATSEDASTETSEGETSTETSEGETSGNEEINVTFTNKYISWKIATGNGGRTDIRATDATSLQLSKFNEVLVAGDNGAFTYDYGKTLADFTDKPEDYAVVVAEYDHETFSYVRKSVAAVGEADDSIKVPKDGFVIAIYKDYTDKINAITTTTNPLFPHGFAANRGLDAKISAASTAPVQDGVINSKEYGKVVWEIEPDNTLVSYAQFEKNDYSSTAKVYMTYDKDYLYVAVEVDTPIHDNGVTVAAPGEMWRFTCIQINVGSAASYSSYMSENYDFAINQTSTNENRMRQYGFGVNNDGESVTTVWQGDSSKKCETFKVVRDGEKQVTIYEMAIAWSDLNDENGEAFAPKKGDKVAFSVSFNLGSTSTEFKNITLRDGGGIIGINDWTKIPTITLN